MNLFIDSRSATFSYSPESFEGLIDRLERAGYEPLMRKAAQSFSNVFGGNGDQVLTFRNAEEDEVEDLEKECEFGRRKLMSLEKLGYDFGLEGNKGTTKTPEIQGEVFFSEDGAGLLFVTVVDFYSKVQDQKSTPDTTSRLRIGFIGDPDETSSLNEFADAVAKAFDDRNVDIKWTVDVLENKHFNDIVASQDDSYHLASRIGEKELKAAKALENVNVRETAQLVRRSGVILAKELLKQKAENASELIKFVDQLLQADLVHQEYVVMCSKTGAHVNRVESRETIEQMGALGVLCSCGKNIASEPIEGLLAADETLQSMLDSNYWMTATVVRLLNSLGVGSDRIILHSEEGSDNVEFIVDIDGTLVLFELKDSEFGLNHAYSLGTRIALQRPKLAFVVSTAGISQEVKDHFKRVKPEAQIVYVANLLQLEATVRKVVEAMRMMRAKTWMSCFQSFVSFSLPAILMPKLRNERFEIPHVVTSVASVANESETSVAAPSTAVR
ncbi:hypothetical protein BH10CYA1_BH10CYA1_35490 [soil metagenome]